MKPMKRMKKMREYDDVTLKRLQSIELMIVNDFKRLCAKHDIPYFAFAGSGIGALRHKGFIPWDDDIDIGFLREDYEKFIHYADLEMSDKYTVMNVEHDPNYPLMTTRWMLKDTVFVEEAFRDVKCELGIFLDLYAFDQVADDPKLRKKQGWETWFYSHLLILRSIPFPVLMMSKWKAKVIHAATAAAYGLLTVTGVSTKKLAAKAKAAAVRYNNGPKTKQVNYFFDTVPDLDLWDYDEIFPLVELPFENTTLTFPNNQDRYLRKLYGDYMTLPPVEKRKNHFPHALDFGIYRDVPLEDLRNPDLYIDPADLKR